MRILVFEYITGGGLINESLPPSLAREGALMANALCEDLLGINDVKLATTFDYRLSIPNWATENSNRTNWVRIHDRPTFKAAWRSQIEWSDAVWPIAPETDGVLESICRDIERSGKILLNSSSDAVRLCASKLNTHDLLAKLSVPVVPTCPLSRFADQIPPPWVVKPDDGVGCDDSRIIFNRKELLEFEGHKYNSNFIVQPYLRGESISLSLWIDQGIAKILSCNRQIIDTRNGNLKLKGCEVNRLRTTPSLKAIADSVSRAIPTLSFYVGIDLIQANDGVFVLEINPRLTTSYAGLYRALRVNPARLMLENIRGEKRINDFCIGTDEVAEIALET